MKLIDASEVVEGNVKNKTTKDDNKNIICGSKIKLVDSSRISACTSADNTVGDIGSHNNKSEDLPKSTVGRDYRDCRDVRTIKLKQGAYYGPKNENKNRFMKMYKSLSLVWKSENIEGMIVDGWFNRDKSQYIIKLTEEGDYKRFKFHGCDDIYSYFMSLGAVKFDYVENSETRVCTDVKANIKGENVPGEYCSYDRDKSFVGADLWSGYRMRQLLRDMPDNWGVIWK